MGNLTTLEHVAGDYLCFIRNSANRWVKMHGAVFLYEVLSRYDKDLKRLGPYGQKYIAVR